jgi:hypothetical protein
VLGSEAVVDDAQPRAVDGSELADDERVADDEAVDLVARAHQISIRHLGRATHGVVIE